MTKISHETKIWFGVHKGTKMKDLSDSYLQYLLDNDISFKAVKHYSKVFRGLNKQK